METFKDNNGIDITVYADKIDFLLHEFYLRFIPESDKEDPDKIEQYITDSPQNRFNAALMYIGNSYFKGNKDLKLKPFTYNQNNRIFTNNNKYDYSLLSYIADLYIYYCSIYDKVVSLNGYSYLTGIAITTIIGWNSDDSKYRVSQDGIQVYKKLFEASESSLSGMLTGKKNPVGVLGILNHLHSWSMPGVSHERVDKRSLTAADLPKLGKLHNDSTIPAIENKNENSGKP